MQIHGKKMAHKMSMKLVFNKETKKVLFAEAQKDVVDFLFYILTIPVATISRISSKHNNHLVTSCLFNLYKSFENLGRSYVQDNRLEIGNILKPRSSLSQQESLLLPDTRPTFNTYAKVNLYGCSCNYNYYVKDSHMYSCKNCCKGSMDLLREESLPIVESGGNGLVKDLVTYFVTDDLEIKPMSTVSSVSLFNQFNVKDLGGIQEMVVDFGMNEGLKILEASLKGKGKDVLTSIYIDKIVKQEPGLPEKKK